MNRLEVACTAALLTFCLAINHADAQTPEERSVRATVRAGVEYDGNALRTDGVDAVEDFLARYFASITLASQPFSQALVVAEVNHGGKFFFEAADADTLLTQIYLGYQHRVVQPFGVFVSLDLKDRTERLSERDYNRGGAAAGIDLFGPGGLSLRAGAAVRYFAFKPTPEASSSNVEGNARLRWQVVDALSTSLSYTLARRSFDTFRFEIEDDAIFEDPTENRRDYFHVGNLGLIYRGPVVVDVGYSLFVNQSNSYGQNLVRHSGEVTVTAPLPWQLFVSAHFELQRTVYDDPVLLDASFQLDEDNRNSMVLSLARTLGESWEVEARYSLYLQEFGVGSDYQRQTFLSALAYLFD